MLGNTKSTIEKHADATEAEVFHRKRLEKFIAITQSCLIFLLIILVVGMMMQIHK